MDQQEEYVKALLRAQSGLKAFISAFVRDRQQSDDIFQDVALTLWQRFSEYDSARSFEAWARGIASKKILKFWKASSDKRMVFSSEALEAVALAYDREEPSISREQEALQDCMKKVPEKSRRLLELRYEKDLPIQDLALQAGTTLDAAHKALSRLRAALHDCIKRRMLPSRAQS